ncbi:hypothetical protein ACPPVO_31615 [Dactylosporangium sp. McL0621]|uniref:hypothetical protein n=1 Tax=Dactylosporangium sp. McL0621 TaxID=3415678 RepID=UPI003CEC6D76
MTPWPLPTSCSPAAGVDAWREALAGAGASVGVHTYPGAGHLFTTPAPRTTTARRASWRGGGA